jgi:hypothetical protein
VKYAPNKALKIKRFMFLGIVSRETSDKNGAREKFPGFGHSFMPQTASFSG